MAQPSCRALRTRLSIGDLPNPSVAESKAEFPIRPPDPRIRSNPPSRRSSSASSVAADVHCELWSSPSSRPPTMPFGCCDWHRRSGTRRASIGAVCGLFFDSVGGISCPVSSKESAESKIFGRRGVSSIRFTFDEERLRNATHLTFYPNLSRNVYQDHPVGSFVDFLTPGTASSRKSSTTRDVRGPENGDEYADMKNGRHAPGTFHEFFFQLVLFQLRQRPDDRLGRASLRFFS